MITNIQDGHLDTFSSSKVYPQHHLSMHLVTLCQIKITIATIMIEYGDGDHLVTVGASLGHLISSALSSAVSAAITGPLNMMMIQCLVECLSVCHTRLDDP